jgi:hypothetical protein
MRIALVPGSAPEEFVIFEFPERSKTSGPTGSKQHLSESQLRATLDVGGTTQSDIDAIIAAARTTALPA